MLTFPEKTTEENAPPRRRIWRILVVFLLLWQVVVLLLAAMSTAAGWCRSAPELSREERDFLVSLSSPSEGQLRESAQMIESALANAEGLPTELRPLRESPKDVPAYRRDEQRLETVYVNLLVHLGRGELQQAADLVEAEKYYGLQVARDAILKLRDSESFALRLELADKLVRFSHGEYTPPLHCGLYGWALDLAAGDAERAAVAYRLGSIAQTRTFPVRTVDARKLHVAIVRLSRLPSADRRAHAGALARLGDLEASSEHNLLAAELFHRAAEAYCGGPDWGRAVFNGAYLLRRAGFPVVARNRLADIFDSQVNDREPGSHLMETNRNYRHRSALEMAASFDDTYNFIMAYYWRSLAARKYRFVSWCGTCAWGADAAISRQLRWSSLKAGPLFVAANFVRFPLRNWGYWAAGVALWVMITRWRRRRARRFTAQQGAPPGT